MSNALFFQLQSKELSNKNKALPSSSADALHPTSIEVRNGNKTSVEAIGNESIGGWIDMLNGRVAESKKGKV